MLHTPGVCRGVCVGEDYTTETEETFKLEYKWTVLFLCPSVVLSERVLSEIEGVEGRRRIASLL